MINGGVGTYLIGEGPQREEFGEYAEQCAYQFDLGVLARELVDCSVTGVTLLGTAPIPQLLNVSQSFQKVVSEARLAKAESPNSWSWSGQALNCIQPDCVFDSLIKIELITTELGLADDGTLTMDECPWSEIQAVFNLL